VAESRPKILNVNDDPSTRYIITRMLQRGGFEVVEAVTGGEALERVLNGPVLVVLDVQLPDLSGFEVCRRIKSDPRTSSIPVLQVSASFVKTENKVQGLEGGADGYLYQPVEAPELIATVRALLRMREAEAEAKRLSWHWRATFDALSDAVCLLDGQGLVVRANKAFQALFGGAATGKAFSELLRAGRAEVPGGTGAEDASGVSEVQLGDRWFRLSADPVLDDAGRRTGGVRVLADLTDRRRLEEELRARAEELSVADKRKDEFLAMLAHELRNPLAAITTGVQVLDRILPAEGRAGRMRELVRRQSRHLSRLVDDLLDVSRITRGKIELRMERVDLCAVVRQAVQVVKPLIDERRHGLEVSLPEAPLWIEADATRVEQVVANLLDNAAKYTEPDGQIRVSAARQGDWAEVKVRDTGLGIPADMLDRVFEPFAQGEQSLARSRGGLGIGLTLVRRLVGMHGGEATVTSPGVGQGSEFSVRLPSLDAAAEHAASQPGASQPEVVNPGSRHIVLVEDNADAREALQDLLHDWGHRVDVAKDGPSAVERVLALKPDVALVDIGLPGIDGYQVARNVRAAPDGKGLFLVALTGYGGSQQRRQALDAGFDLHLVKPVEPDELARLLKELPTRTGGQDRRPDASNAPA